MQNYLEDEASWDLGNELKEIDSNTVIEDNDLFGEGRLQWTNWKIEY